MSANRFTVACCIGTLGVAVAAVVVAVQAPRPLHGSGTEDQRAARRAVQGQVWVAVPVP